MRKRLDDGLKTGLGRRRPSHELAPRTNVIPLHYGIDAPTVVRNFFLIGVAGWIVGTILPKFGSGHCRTGWLVSMALV